MAEEKEQYIPTVDLRQTMKSLLQIVIDKHKELNKAYVEDFNLAKNLLEDDSKHNVKNLIDQLQAVLSLLFRYDRELFPRDRTDKFVETWNLFVTEIDLQKGSLTDEVKQLSSTKASIESKNEQLTSKLIESEKKQTEQSIALARLTSEKENQLSVLAELTSTYKKLQQDCASLQRLKEEQEATFATQIRIKDRQIAGLTAASSSEQTRIEKLYGDIQKINSSSKLLPEILESSKPVIKEFSAELKEGGKRTKHRHK